MDTLRTLTTLFPLALTSGINLYATVLIVGLCVRFDWVEGIPPSLDPLGSWVVIILAAVLYVVEFIVDKFDFFDNIWDVVHTLIRPVAVVVISAAALWNADPIVLIVGCLLAGSTTLTVHGSKAGSRVMISTTGEPVSTVVVSLGEDGLAIALAWFALVHPIVASVFAGVLLVLAVLLLVLLWRKWKGRKARAS
ncbi:MAG: hypothetical protein AMS16_02075 [Planctomycetes bacterium DG_58]|nr:MAG: hypothetical protein AMS16_02075 [Planctomycetes bacterium DG_58]KPL01511.1 MAG: hypothetical protein AMK75_04535 [Planctomycetes bacterium SM23_65]